MLLFYTLFTSLRIFTSLLSLLLRWLVRRITLWAIERRFIRTLLYFINRLGFVFLLLKSRSRSIHFSDRRQTIYLFAEVLCLPWFSKILFEILFLVLFRIERIYPDKFRFNFWDFREHLCLVIVFLHLRWHVHINFRSCSFRKNLRWVSTVFWHPSFGIRMIF